ncbi:cell envelope integrity protein TolA [Orbus sturtevantii]|uniref:cell envelope integrity protein TolA n=1 Tax=Orbus sturtevantii TaxID=3074109 RepID=UPI00370D2EF9
MLAYSAWHYSSIDRGNAQSQSIEAIMVDSNIMSEQYQRQLQHRVSSQQVKQQQQAQIEKQAQDLQQQQLAEQQRLKTLEKERLLAVDKQRQQEEKAKMELKEQQEQALIAKQQAELATQKALAEAEQARQEVEKQKQQLEQQRLKVEQENQKKQKAAQEAKRKAAEEKQQREALDDILGGLTSNVPKSQQGVSTADFEQFKSQINNAISNKFINPKLYSGKNCVLAIEIASDGLLLSVTAKEGDPILCREAISATKLATLPKAKNSQLYQRVKSLEIDFRPN